MGFFKSNVSKNILRFMKVKVSICIPIFNGERFLEECLLSVKNQTFKDFEIVFSDDKSTDLSLNIVEKFLRDSSWIKSKVVINDIRGIGENWNNCLRNASGEFIKFLFQDDLLESTCLEKMVDFLDLNNNVALVGSKRSFIVSHNNVSSNINEWIKTYSDLQKEFRIDGEFFLFDQSLFKRLDFLEIPRNKIGEPSTVMFRKEVIEKVGFFRNDLEQSLDYEYWYRILKYYNIAILDEKLVKFRLHPQQATIVNKNRSIQDYDIYEKIIFFNYFLLISSSLRKKLFFKVTSLGKLIFKFYKWIFQKKKSV